MRRGPGLYSRLVALLKIGLPLLALLLLGTVFLFDREDELGGGLGFSRADLEALGSGLSVRNPNLSGRTDDGDIYDVTAAVVVPTDATFRLLDAETLDGTLTLTDGRVVTFRADRGRIDLDAQDLDLADGVEIETSDGFTARADTARADLERATMRGEGSVVATGPMGRITSDRVRIVPRERGAEEKVIWFEGRVRMIYRPAEGSEE